MGAGDPKIFKAVARFGGMSRAAAELHTDNPAAGHDSNTGHNRGAAADGGVGRGQDVARARRRPFLYPPLPRLDQGIAGRRGRGLALLGAVALLMAGPLGAALLARPAAAQQAAPGAGRAAAPHPLNLQPPPAPDPRPAAGAPRLAPGSPEAQDCVPAWPCRFRLFGEIEKYGGVGLKATALTW
jgi:hypothetical protein